MSCRSQKYPPKRAWPAQRTPRRNLLKATVTPAATLMPSVWQNGSRCNAEATEYVRHSPAIRICRDVAAQVDPKNGPRMHATLRGTSGKNSVPAVVFPTLLRLKHIFSEAA